MYLTIPKANISMWCAVSVLLFISGSSLAQEKLETQPERSQYLAQVLKSPLPAEAKGVEGTLNDVLNYLEELVTPSGAARDPSLRVKFWIEELGFKETIDENYRVQEVTIILPKLGGVSLDKALEIVLGQVNAGCYVTNDFIQILHCRRLMEKTNQMDRWEQGIQHIQKLPSLVHMNLDGILLNEALKTISKEKNVNIVFAPQVGNRIKTPITANLLNVPVDAAIEMLVEIADLSIVRKRNIFYVVNSQGTKAQTSKEIPNHDNIHVVALQQGGEINNQIAADTTEDVYKLVDRLYERIPETKAIEMPLGEVIETVLKGTYKLPVIVDQDASTDPESLKILMEQKIILKPMKHVRLDTLLKTILQQVEQRQFVIYPDHIKIVTRDQFIHETGQWNVEENNQATVPTFQLVHLKLEKKLLKDAINQIVDRTGANIVLANNLDVDITVSAKFLNAPVATAVETLAEMCNLGVVRKKNVYYITTQDRATALHEKPLDPAAGLGGPFGGVGGIGVPALIDDGSKANQEKQIKELQKRLEELEKKLKQ